MNGQRGRQEIVRTLVGLRPPAAVVETGTYLGVSTEFFAYMTGAPVWTCESQPIYFRAARKRFQGNSAIHPVLADARDFLQTLATAAEVPKNDVLFYLDAHWDGNLPLREEVRVIGSSWNRPWIVIDDFQVPDDPDYRYDDYGPGAALVLDYLEPAPWWAALWPTLKGSDENGARAGCVVLVPPEDVDRVVATGVLRRA